MATKPFTATIGNEKKLIYQNGDTGLFFTIDPDGKHTPVEYSTIRMQTPDMQRLKYWRNRYGYTQAELAKLVRVSQSTVIMSWESGLRHPREEYRQRLNAELGGDVFPD